MIPRIQFRYGLDLVARCGLLLWSFGWLIGIVFVLIDEKVNSQGAGGAETYTRAEAPGTYWTLVGVAAAMCLLGLALTFELEFKDSTKSPEADDDG